MIPAILQTDWMNSATFKPGTPGAQVESFFLKANDPRHRHALWVRLNLTSQGKEQFAESQAIFFDGEAGAVRTAEERWPMQRVQIDCERAGVGIGESNIQEGASCGVVRGNDFSISWDLHMDDEAEGYGSYPAPWLYKGDWCNHKVATPHPTGSLHGQLEIWHRLARHTPATKFNLRGWRAMQGHRWGTAAPERSAWVHCNTFASTMPGTFFEAYTAPVQVARILNPNALVGRLHVDGHTYHFDTWRNLFGTPGRFNPTDWAFELTGPDGTVRGKVTADPKGTAALVSTSTRAHRFSNPFAQLTLELKPTHGPARTLTSDTAGFEVAQPEPRGAISAPARAA